MARGINVPITGDASRYVRELRKAQGASSKFGVAAKAALVTGAAAGFYALGKAAKIGWDEYNQGAKVAAQTNAVIKSTGGVANVSAQHVEDLGHALMLKSGIDDEVVKSGENVLLTFRGIHNEVGKGNDIFDQATKATLDLSVAMGRDMSDSAIQVGKALNDPIRGVTALRRVGVQFTDAQTKLIAKLVETGHKAEAQRVILRELRAEFGGSAKAAGETLPGKLAILRERFRNFTGDLVGKTIPALSNFVDFIDKVGKGKDISVKIRTVLSGAGTALENLLFGGPATRIRVPVDQRHFEWVVKGGGTGLVGAIGNAIRDINWTHVGELIAAGMKEAGQKGGDALAEQLRSTVRDKLSDPRGLLGAAWTAEKVEAEFLPATHVWRAIWGAVEGDASAATREVGRSVDSIKPHMGSTASATRTFAGAMAEHLDLVAGRARNADSNIEQLRAVVTSLHSKTIYVNAVVSGLGYVAALQEHLSLIHSQNVSVGVQGRQHGGPVGAGSPYMVGERGPELFVPSRSGRIVPGGNGGGGGEVRVIVVGGDAQAIRYFNGLFGRDSKRNG